MKIIRLIAAIAMLHAVLVAQQNQDPELRQKHAMEMSHRAHFAGSNPAKPPAAHSTTEVTKIEQNGINSVRATRKPAKKPAAHATAKVPAAAQSRNRTVHASFRRTPGSKPISASQSSRPH